MPPSPQRPAGSRRGIVLLGLLVLAAVAAALAFGDRLSLDALRENRDALIALRDSHYAFAVGGFILAYVAIVALSLPGATVATLTGGFLFGTFPGVLFNVAGATLGAILIFAAVRAGLGARIAARMDADAGAAGRLKAAIDANQWSALFLLRLVPAVPFFVANVLPALFGVPVWRFAVTTALGIVPGALVFTSAGAGLSAVFDAGGTPDLSLLSDPRILLPILGLCLLAALPVLLRAFRRNEVKQ